MNPEYKKIILKSKATKKMIVEIESQIASSKDTVNEKQAAFEEIKAGFGALVLKGDAKEIAAAEAAMDRITGKHIRRGQAKIQTLEKKLAGLREEVAGLEKQRVRVLAKLIKAWLVNTGIRKYDTNANAAVSHAKALQAAHQMLREIGAQTLFKEMVGEVFPFLIEARIPIIEGFDRSEYIANPRFQVTDAIYKNIFSEIVDQ